MLDQFTWPVLDGPNRDGSFLASSIRGGGILTCPSATMKGGISTTMFGVGWDDEDVLLPTNPAGPYAAWPPTPGLY